MEAASEAGTSADTMTPARVDSTDASEVGEEGEEEDEYFDDLEEEMLSDEEEEEEELVPIRLELFLDGTTFKDTFTWNINETTVTPEQFAKSLCLDMDYPPHFEEAIANSIHKQLTTYHTWKSAIREKRVRISSKHSLILIQLNLTINDKSLQDQFEWDIRNKHISPESFAQTLCSDLGLGREFSVSVAHSIREQINQHLQAVVEGSDFIWEQWVRPVVRTALRSEEELPLWTPSVSSSLMLPMVRPDRVIRSLRRETKS